MIENWKKTLFFACLSAISLISVQLWYNSVSQNVKKDQGTSIGYLVEVEKNVLIKQVKKMLWLPTEKGEPVYSGEVVKTKNNSSCEIVLNRGDKIVLEENSMIVLNTDEDSLDLELIDGNLFLDKKSKIKLKTGNKEITLAKNSKIKLDKKEDITKVQVLKGEIEIEGKRVEEGNQIIEEKGVLEVKEIEVVNMTPYFNYSKSTFKNEVLLTFNWQSNNKEKEEFFIFKDGKKIYSQATNLKKLKKKIKPGQYFWQVKSKDSFSPRNSFKIIKAEKTRPFLPENGQTLYAKEGEMIDFSFLQGKNINNSYLILSQNKNFSNSIKKKITNSSLSLKLDHKKYWWKVLSQVGDEKQESEVLTFEIKNKPKNITITKIIPEGETLQGVSGEEKNISWEADNYQSVYFWEVLIDGKKHKINKNFYKYKIYETKKIEIQIVAKSKEGFSLGEKTGHIYIEKIPHIKNITWEKRPKVSSGKGNIKLSVKNFEEIKNCKVFLNNKIIENQCENISLKNLLPGKYKVFIEGEDKFNRKIYTREPASFIVPKKSSVKAPIIKKVKVGGS